MAKEKATVELKSLEIGDSGLLVYIMQSALKYRGYTSTAPSSHFGMTTFETLREFRKQHYLEGDTVCDELTWRELLKD